MNYLNGDTIRIGDTVRYNRTGEVIPEGTIGLVKMVGTSMVDVYWENFHGGWGMDHACWGVDNSAITLVPVAGQETQDVDEYSKVLLGEPKNFFISGPNVFALTRINSPSGTVESLLQARDASQREMYSQAVVNLKRAQDSYVSLKSRLKVPVKLSVENALAGVRVWEDTKDGIAHTYIAAPFKHAPKYIKDADVTKELCQGHKDELYKEGNIVLTQLNDSTSTVNLVEQDLVTPLPTYHSFGGYVCLGEYREKLSCETGDAFLATRDKIELLFRTINVSSLGMHALHPIRTSILWRSATHIAGNERLRVPNYVGKIVKVVNPNLITDGCIGRVHRYNSDGLSIEFAFTHPSFRVKTNRYTRRTIQPGVPVDCVEVMPENTKLTTQAKFKPG